VNLEIFTDYRNIFSIFCVTLVYQGFLEFIFICILEKVCLVRWLKCKMAEAHSAVGFQFTVTPDGIDIDFNRQALKAVVSSGKRSYRKRLIRFFNR
jgi:hypothetical protein